MCMFLFFFFQAEDGIRDGHVTGVQTCALPISQRVGFLQVVGCEQYRLTLGLQAQNVVPQRASTLDVDAECRLVEKQELRIMQKSLASASRRFMPPENVLTRLASLSVSCTRSTKV